MGKVSEAKIIVDRDTNLSRGFGFITFNDEKSAKNAVQTMERFRIYDCSIRLKYADNGSNKPIK